MAVNSLRQNAAGLYYTTSREIAAMVIILMGVTGAGKTTVGQALAAELHWRFADADGYHSAANVAKMHAGIPLSDADREPWLDVAASRHLRVAGRGRERCAGLLCAQGGISAAAADRLGREADLPARQQRTRGRAAGRTHESLHESVTHRQPIRHAGSACRRRDRRRIVVYACDPG